MTKISFLTNGGAMSKLSRRVFLGGVGAGLALPSVASAEVVEPETLEDLVMRIIEKVKSTSDQPDAVIRSMCRLEDGSFSHLLIAAPPPEGYKGEIYDVL